MSNIDITRATSAKSDVVETIEDMFTYRLWSAEEIRHGDFVRRALMHAFSTIIDHVPPSPDRSSALRKLREARMDCNSAITHQGKY